MTKNLSLKLPKLSIVPNHVSSGGFVYGIEYAFLGNCLSTFANLICFSIRSGVPVIYPHLMQHSELFDFSGHQLPYIFSPHQTIISTQGIDDLYNFCESIMVGYYDAYSKHVASIPPEWLGDLGRLSHATVFLNYQMGFRDWELYEAAIRGCSLQSNGVVIPGAYWWQYRDIDQRAIEPIRERLSIKHKDLQARRSVRMANSDIGVKIGMHVRRGDYQNYRDGSYFWDIEIYAEIMRKISRQMGERPHLFILCSNDNWTDMQLEGLPCCYEHGSSFDDFVALSQCDYVVGPPSTYANWASFLGRRKRLILTPEMIAPVERVDINKAREIRFPTASGVPDEFWVIP